MVTCTLTFLDDHHGEYEDDLLHEQEVVGIWDAGHWEYLERPLLGTLASSHRCGKQDL